MDISPLIRSMENFKQTLPVLVDGVSGTDAIWKPPSGNWSILEIVCHLIDEEVDDFKIRLRLTLEPGEKWPAWDPEGCAVSRKYQERDLKEMVDRFVEEREQSLEWLKGLGNVDWNTSYDHSKMGPMSAGNLLASWVAHDQLHLRQIAKRKFEMILRDSQPYDASYAGAW